MKTEPILPASETAIRITATDPEVDAWVAANAGSGKTTILRNRVVRLLLDGVAPDRILCLTFTKAAAAEMQARVFAELARWVRLDDAALTAEIGRLITSRRDPVPIPPADLAYARTLFARAIEAPGGLKIQTIHAFAERVLHLFPLEAGVPLDFTILGEAEAHDLREAARHAMIEAAIAKPASPLGKAFGEVLIATGTEGFAKALDSALSVLSALALRDGALPRPADRERAYRAAFGIGAGENLVTIDADFAAAAIPAETLSRLADAVRANRKCTGPQQAFAVRLDHLAALRRAGGPWRERYLDEFVTDAGEVTRKALFAKAVTDADPEILAIEAAAKDAVARLLERRRAFLAFTRSIAVSIVGERVAAQFSAAKRARGLLDFDDLIAAVRRMIGQGQASWMMMKLDASIEHILIDEAQDTTPAMWDIVRGLTEEFFAGEGQARRRRSLFVVGDEKQSIFSFQGADPEIFEETRRYFAARSLRPAHIANPVALNYSFRSSDDVLGAVDAIFAEPTRAAGLTATAPSVRHIAARQNFPGRVELWPLVRPADQAGEGPAAAGQRPAPVLLAEAIAGTIATWFAGGERHLADGTRICPGDIVILVRRRNRFFSAMLRALKSRGIPVAGADRLKLQAEIAIRDLLVIAEAMLLQEDDLALATALKSPLFGLGDDDLERLARGREGSLWDAVLAAGPAPHLVRVGAALARLHQAARTLSPLDFFAGLLADPAPADPAMSGRKAILTRLGTDAGDPIDAFLTEAAEFSRQVPGSLLLFTRAQRNRDTEIKRDLEQGGDRVRIMTAHGAKGLEGRIVFLGDTAETPERAKEPPAFLLAPVGAEAPPLLVWAGTKDDEPPVMRAARKRMRAAQLAEYRRLFYVAMTRAADRLYITGYARRRSEAEIDSGRDRPPPEDAMEWSWYQLAEAGLAGRADAIDLPARLAGIGENPPPRPIRRFDSLIAPAPAVDPGESRAAPPVAVPAWLSRPVSPAPPPDRVLRPSEPGSRSAIGSAGDGSAALRRRGRLIHHLYEALPRLPAEQHRAAGLALIARLAPELAPEAAEAVLGPIRAVLASPAGRQFFGPESRAEVAIAGTILLPDGAARAVSARLDRLVVGAARVDILDIKSGHARDPAVLRQMALYRALVRAIYPGRPVGVTLLRVEANAFETLGDGELDAAFAAITAD